MAHIGQELTLHPVGFLDAHVGVFEFAGLLVEHSGQTGQFLDLALLVVADLPYDLQVLCPNFLLLRSLLGFILFPSVFLHLLELSY